MNRSSAFKFVFSILAIILSVLLVFSIFKFCFTGNTFSFSSFLNSLGSIDSISINFSLDSLYINGDWGVVDFLRGFLNIFANALSVIIYIATQLINLLLFVGQFIGLLFA